MATAPPGFVGAVLGAVLDLNHLDEVLFGVEPGSLDHKRVNMRPDLLVLNIVSVEEVERDNNRNAFEGAGKCNTNIAG